MYFTTSVNGGLCDGSSCQHFSMRAYLKKINSKTKRRTIREFTNVVGSSTIQVPLQCSGCVLRTLHPISCQSTFWCTSCGSMPGKFPLFFVADDLGFVIYWQFRVDWFIGISHAQILQYVFFSLQNAIQRRYYGIH